MTLEMNNAAMNTVGEVADAVEVSSRRKPERNHEALCAPSGHKVPRVSGRHGVVADAAGRRGQRSGRSGPDRRDEYAPEILREEIRKAKTLTDKPRREHHADELPYADAVVQVVIERKVPVVTTGAGMPGTCPPGSRPASR